MKLKFFIKVKIKIFIKVKILNDKFYFKSNKVQSQVGKILTNRSRHFYPHSLDLIFKLP